MNKISRYLWCVFLLLATTVCLPHRGTGQNGPSEEVRKAQVLYQSKDYDGAIKILEEFVASHPSANLAHLWLGNCYREKGALDKALDAYLKAALAPPTRGQATLSAAVIQTRKNNFDGAFELLQQLRRSGTFDMDLIKDSADLRPLHPDARFSKIIPRAEDFANPFVDKAKIIHKWSGETKGDQFGWIARRIGDVDADKVNDLVASAPTYSANGATTGPGRVYAYSGKTANLLWTATGKPGEALGTVLEKAGDVNADGVPDVIAGAPGSERAYVYSGRDGAVLWTLTSRTGQERFGGGVSSAGDQNGDGFADVIVGARANSDKGQGTGRAYVFSGRDGSLLLTLSGENAGDNFGSTVTGSGGKQNRFLVIGAPGAGANRRGRVYVYRGLTEKASFVIDSDETGAQLGAMFVSLVGDVDGDKVPDVYASDWNNSAKGAATGRIYVHSGADGRRLLTLTGESAGDGFGIGSADAGDVNRDGFDDLLIGAWQHASAAPSGGKVYLYSGKDGSLLKTITCRIAGDTFGFDTTGMGDVNGDGIVDFLVTSAWSAVNGFRSGRMFLISGASQR